MSLDFVHRMVGQILVELGDNALLHVCMKGVAQIGQGPRRACDDDGLDLAFADQGLERGRYIAGEFMLLDVVPVGGFKAASAPAADTGISPARLIRALVMRVHIVKDL